LEETDRAKAEPQKLIRLSKSKMRNEQFAQPGEGHGMEHSAIYEPSGRNIPGGVMREGRQASKRIIGERVDAQTRICFSE
jgi:hypothetical protein